MSIKEFFGKAAAGIYVSGLSVIALVVALIGYRPMWDNMTIVYAILEAVATAIFAKNAASYIQSVSVGLAKLTVSFEVAVVAYVLALVIAIISGFLNRRKMEA